MPATTFTMKIAETEKQFLQLTAKERGTTISKLMREGANLLALLDKRALDYINHLVVELEMARGVIISNEFIRIIARMDAYREFWGTWPDDLAEPYWKIPNEEGRWRPVTGEELYLQLHEDYLRKCKAERIQFLEEKAADGLISPEEQAELDLHYKPIKARGKPDTGPGSPEAVRTEFEKFKAGQPVNVENLKSKRRRDPRVKVFREQAGPEKKSE